MMKTISILGSGWLGYPLSKVLSKDFEIKLSTTTNEKLKNLQDKNIIPYFFDIKNISSSDLVFLDADILIVNIPLKEYEPYKNLLNIALKRKVQKIIFVSTTSVYKDTNTIVKENEENNLSDSIWVEIEKLFINSTIPTTILRFGGLIGAGRNMAKYFINKEVTNSNAPVNLLHQKDAKGLIKQVIKKQKYNTIINCCASSHPSKKEFYSYCAKIGNFEILGFDERKGSFKIIDNSYSKELLNYEYKYDDLFQIDNFSKI